MKLNDKQYKDKESNENKPPSILINCNLEVELDNRNKAIYLCPEKVQYFTFKVLKSCGNVTISYQGDSYCSDIYGKLGRYRMFEDGIIIYAYCNLNPKDIDILYFTATDDCTNSCNKFTTVFAYDPCACCRDNKM